MKHLLIIGARKLGREILDLVLDSIDAEGIEVKGYLDDNPNVLDGFTGYPPIISSVEDYQPQADDVFFCALGDIKYRRHYSEMILKKGGVFINLIHPSAIIGRRVKMGIGCCVGKYVTINSDVEIGSFVFIAAHAGISHDDKIGNYAHIGGHVGLGGGVIVEDDVTIHPHAYVVPNKTIHKGALVGAGSVVFTNVKEKTTVLGNPAKKVDF